MAWQQSSRPLNYSQFRQTMKQEVSIFLSASIPYGERAKKYLPDPIAIREAVRSLVTVMSPRLNIVFGGHPAINPFVLDAARTLNTIENIHIFQSEDFIGEIPEEVPYFEHIRWTAKKENRQISLRHMREEIMRPKKYGIPPYRAAFFIGGMNGVIEEWDLFRTKHPDQKRFPLASTEGAARHIATTCESDLKPEWKEEIRYHYLFSEILKKFF